MNREIKRKTLSRALILVNEYDGVDLPDDTCRILVLDSLPSYISLIEQYNYECRPNSPLIKKETAQRVEQGLGRAIRGPSDYCVVFILGKDLESFLSEKSKRTLFSEEMQKQLEIGEELANIMKKDEKKKLWKVIFSDIIDQCLKSTLREEGGWKDYYKERMSDVRSNKNNKIFMHQFVKELAMEDAIQNRQYQKAINIVDDIIDSPDIGTMDKGWYLQLKAIYLHQVDPVASQEVQLRAFELNKRLFKPEKGITYSKLLVSSTNQSYNILSFIRSFTSFNSLKISISNVLDHAIFDIDSDTFENMFNSIGQLLGFHTQRPDKEYGSGPDILWQISVDYYWIIECKNEVKVDRGISKKEANQLMSHSAWFKAEYGRNKRYKIIVIHQSNFLTDQAFIDEDLLVMGPNKLSELKKLIDDFYIYFVQTAFSEINESIIQKQLAVCSLDFPTLEQKFFERVIKN